MKDEKKRHRLYFEWFQLIISISISITIAVYTILENNRDQAIAIRNHAEDLKLVSQQRQETIFQDCLKKLGKLVEEYGEDLSQSSSAILVARFTTLSALNQLDRDQRNFLVRLLYDAKLITYESVDSQPIISLDSADLTDLNLLDEIDQRVLIHLSLVDTILNNANFHQINIYGARFHRAVLINADFSWTWNSPSFDEFNYSKYSPDIFFNKANLTSTNFYAAVYDHVDFTDAIMFKTNMKNFFCVQCSFLSTMMNEVHLENSDIQNSSFTFARLDYANFYQTYFHKSVDFYRADMRYVNASYANFTQCDFTGANLLHTQFDHAVIINSTFPSALMKNVSLEYSRIINGNFVDANLVESNWRYTYCENCVFDGANFTNARFVQCDFRNSILTDEQLKQIASLENSKFFN